MRIATPFANYLPGTSLLHKADARIKLLLVAAYAFAVFACATWPGLMACIALLATATIHAKVPLRRLLRGIVPVCFILAFTFLGHALGAGGGAVEEGGVPLLFGLVFSPEGALDGLFFMLRIAALVSVTTLFTLTSPIVAATDAIAALLGPLRRLRVPVDDISMMLTIALRFIPLTAEEAEKAMLALAARGVRFNEGGPIRRVRAYVPVMVPLFVGLFRRADTLALAMESRCYDGSVRTRRATRRLLAGELICGIIGSVVLIALGVFL